MVIISYLLNGFVFANKSTRFVSCFGCVEFHWQKLSYKTVRIIRFLGVISIWTKWFRLKAPHQFVYKSECLYTVSRNYADLNFAREFMLSGHPAYESLKRSEKPQHTRLHVDETIVGPWDNSSKYYTLIQNTAFNSTGSVRAQFGHST